MHVFQIALAQQFVEYLYIQKDFAGLTPFPTNLPDSEYIKRTRNHSLNILDHLKKNGWKGIANPELVEYLDKHITLPEDLTSVSRIGTHDLNLSKDLKGKDTLIDPKITIGIDGLIGFGNFNVEIISPEGNGYIEIPFSKMMGSRQNELSRFFDDQDVLVEWTSFPKLIDINELPRTHFVVSRSKSVEDEAHHIILSHRANHGFARRHLHLVGRKIFQSTGHFRQDG
ncbi:MAG: hypothetical protein E6R05_02585 [Candidatus Moraniibacteriota bacterium]|nr:MAG: hypothetical protein E6R05_02585 [Candidatus Moranbacteria bacterium]